MSPRSVLPACLVAAVVACNAISHPSTEPLPEAPPQAQRASAVPDWDTSARAATAAAIAPFRAERRPGDSETRERCAHHDDQRQAFFGELHLHSKHSFDANQWDVRATPDDAYRFARGEAIAFPPVDADGRSDRMVSLSRPLDFAAVTDHGFFLGAVSLCTVPGAAEYDTERCRIYRGEIVPPDMDPVLGRFSALIGGNLESAFGAVPQRSPELCGKGGDGACLQRMGSVWREIQASAERFYDRSAACRFTTFHAYEYTATPNLAKVHRNVIFRNETNLDLPISWLDEPNIEELWRRLRRECIDAGNGCDVLTIPHNSNLSNGRIFTLPYKEMPLEEQRRRAALRRELEPLVEITQIKGDSECKNGMFGIAGGPDEACDYEKLRDFQPAPVTDCGERTSFGALSGQGCQSRLDFVRYALVEGLREADRIGVNPLRLGMMAATDAHNANPGDVDEWDYDGWAGVTDDTATKRLAGNVAALPQAAVNPGGLMGVWAEENARDALFDAMLRKETFATSGPRMSARFFGGWDYDASVCDAADLVAQGDAGGVPMGGDLPPAPPGADAPSFIVAGMRDPGTAERPGGLLQRAQIVKGFVGDDGQFHQRVYDVAGGASSASVDTATCTPRGSGADTLCGVWRDPDFDPGRRAVYYLRVLENPSCRWTTWQCNALPEGGRPEACDDPRLPKTIQERLWTSPIWYTPPGVNPA